MRRKYVQHVGGQVTECTACWWTSYSMYSMLVDKLQNVQHVGGQVTECTACWWTSYSMYSMLVDKLQNVQHVGGQVTVCWWTSYRIVPVTDLNKYLYSGESEMKVNVNKSSENPQKTQQLSVC